jgi:hypothetical protein
MVSLRLRLEAHREGHIGLLGQQELRQFRTEALYLRLKTVIEHVADHGHAATHPLPATSQFWMVKLRHSAVAAYQRLQQRLHRVGTDGVALSQFVNCCHDSADRFPAPRRARSSRALTTSAGSRLRSASPPGLALGRCFGRRSRSSPRRTSCTFRSKKRRCAVSSARPTTVMLRGWGAGCEAPRQRRKQSRAKASQTGRFAPGAIKLGSCLTDATRGGSRPAKRSRSLPLCCGPNGRRNSYRGSLTRWNHARPPCHKAYGKNLGPAVRKVKERRNATSSRE